MSYAAFTKRMASDAGRIHWQPKHYEMLAKHYKVDADQVVKLVSPQPTLTAYPPDMELKAAPDVQRSFKFVMNDGEIDRSGDVVVAAGVKLNHFKKSPIALLQHDPNRPIGTWSGVHVSGGKLKGTLTLATDAIPLAERVRKGIAGGVYRALSIGFQPDEIEFTKTGITFHTSELMEGSVVAIGASRGALLERELTPDERREQAAELIARIKSDDAKWQREVEAKQRHDAERQKAINAIPEVAAARAKIAQAKARREEQALIAGMSVDEHTRYLNAKVERKEQRKRQLEELKRGQA